MFARVITAQVQHDRVHEAAHLFQEVLLPALVALPGFQGALLLLNRQNGRSQAILMWNSEADLAAGEADQAFQRNFRQVADAFLGTPFREMVEIMVWH